MDEDRSRPIRLCFAFGLPCHRHAQNGVSKLLEDETHDETRERVGLDAFQKPSQSLKLGSGHCRQPGLQGVFDAPAAQLSRRGIYSSAGLHMFLEDMACAPFSQSPCLHLLIQSDSDSDSANACWCPSFAVFSYGLSALQK